MKIYIELWNAKDAWLAVSEKERENYLAQIGPALQDLVVRGVEIVAWGKNDKSTAHRANYDFISIFKFPNDTLIQEFEGLVEGAGWYNYFDQVNASGLIVDPTEIIGKMIEL
jgi:hypothetical protein